MSLRTALVVETPEAEDAIGAHRLWNDPVASRGVPAHVTLVVPFKEPKTLNGSDLDELSGYFASVQPFSYTLTGFGRFEDEGVLWLRPQPAGPFIALTEGLIERFPDHRPYGGSFDEIVPHLTIAQNLPEARAYEGLEEAIGPFLPITCRAEHVTLLEEAPNGMWSVRAQFKLGARR